MLFKSRRPVHLYGAAVVAGLFTLSGYAVAQLRTSTSEVRACVQADGTMRWAGSGGRCRSGERRLSWSQRGPQGPAGAPGDRGLTGGAGPQGLRGPAGDVSLSQVTTTCMTRNEFGTSITGTPATTVSGPSNEGSGCLLGEVRLVAGRYAPKGFVPAAGQLMPITANAGLYSFLGATYGGDGRTNFALPDLRGHGPGQTSYVICVNGSYPHRN